MISSELEEVIEGSDRVFVLRDGRTVAELPRSGLSEMAVMTAMAQGRRPRMAASDSAAAGEVRASGPRIAAWLGRYGTGLALVLLILFNFAFTRNFATWQTLNINLTQVSTIVIVAIGMTLVIGSGGIDLSVGSLMAIAAALAPLLFLNRIVEFPNIYVGVAAAFTLPVILAGAFGFFNGWLITRYKVQPIVATLILFIAGARHRAIVHRFQPA